MKIDPTISLKVEHVVDNDHPIPSHSADAFSKPNGWIETREAMQSRGFLSIYMVDFEMVHTPSCMRSIRIKTKGYQYLRVTADGQALTRVYIVDYLTWCFSQPRVTVFARLFSSRFDLRLLAFQLLEPTTTTFSGVQSYLRTLIAPSTILLSHLLESDLRALRFSHPRCIDIA